MLLQDGLKDHRAHLVFQIEEGDDLIDAPAALHRHVDQIQAVAREDEDDPAAVRGIAHEADFLRPEPLIHLRVGVVAARALGLVCFIHDDDDGGHRLDQAEDVFLVALAGAHPHLACFLEDHAVDARFLGESEGHRRLARSGGAAESQRHGHALGIALAHVASDLHQALLDILQAADAVQAVLRLHHLQEARRLILENLLLRIAHQLIVDRPGLAPCQLVNVIQILAVQAGGQPCQALERHLWGDRRALALDEVAQVGKTLLMIRARDLLQVDLGRRAEVLMHVAQLRGDEDDDGIRLLEQVLVGGPALERRHVLPVLSREEGDLPGGRHRLQVVDHHGDARLGGLQRRLEQAKDDRGLLGDRLQPGGILLAAQPRKGEEPPAHLLGGEGEALAHVVEGDDLLLPVEEAVEKLLQGHVIAVVRHLIEHVEVDQEGVGNSGQVLLAQLLRPRGQYASRGIHLGTWLLTRNSIRRGGSSQSRAARLRFATHRWRR